MKLTKEVFSIRADYREYLSECIDEQREPTPFREWAETWLHYDYLDNLDSDITGYSLF